MVVIVPNFSDMIGPYILESFVRDLCGFLPSSKMLPMMGSGCGPGGSFLEFWAWFDFLRMKIRMVAHIKVISRRSV